MMTLAEWYKREDLRLAWEDLLKNNEALKAAMEVCLSNEADLRAANVLRRGGDPVQAQALEGARREGYFQCLRELRALANQMAVRQETPEPWVGKKSVREAGRTV